MSVEMNTGQLGVLRSGAFLNAVQARFPPPKLATLPDGERKVVTVLFVDIIKSTRMVVGNDPEDANDLMLSILQALVDQVHRFGGTVTQVLGDGFLALFGAPVAQEDHALRACLAAQEMHRATRHLNRSGLGKSEHQVSIRVGLSSGEVVAGSINNDLNLEYRAAGESVILARRMEQDAPPGSTKMTGDTFGLVSEHVEVKEGDVFLIEGRRVRTFELRSIHIDKLKRLTISRWRNPSFFGREQDLALLETGLREMRLGTGRVIIIKGQPGIGKSRLLLEFLERPETRRCKVVRCDLLPLGLADPRDTLASILWRLYRISAAASDSPGPEQISDWLRGLKIDPQRATAAVCEVLGLTIENQTWLQLDPTERLRTTVFIVADLVRAVSQAHSLILLLDDFHWADSQIRLLTEELSTEISRYPVFLVMATRTNYENSLATWPDVAEHEIQSLSRPDCVRLLRSMLGSHSSLADLISSLVHKTQGNPFFLEECVRALEESGALAGEPGKYRLGTARTEMRIPATVHGVLAARIDGLPASDRSILLCASVIGQSVDFRLLRDLTDTKLENLFGALARLETAGFLQQTRILPNLEYSFRHALVHDVAYATLLKRKRRILHRQVVHALRGRGRSSLPGKIEKLAYHAVQAELWPEAYIYARRAGQTAQKHSRNREAANFCEWTLSALGHLPDSKRNREREVDIRLSIVQALFPLGEHRQVDRHLKKAEDIARALNDQRRLGRIASERVPFFWSVGNLSEAVRQGNLAVEIAERLDYSWLGVQVGTRLGCLIADLGDYRSACQRLESTVSRLGLESNFDHFGIIVIASVGCLTTWSRCLGELGDFERAMQVGDQGLRIADESKHSLSQSYACLYAINPLLRKGDFARSLPSLERALEICDAMRARLLYPICAASLGYAYVRLGHTKKGLELLEKGVRVGSQHSIRYQLAQQLAWMAEGYLLAGRVEEAEEVAIQALESAREHGEKGDEAWVMWLLGEISSKTGTASLSLSERYFRDAIAIAKDCGMRPLIGHCHAGLGKIYLARGAYDEAQNELRLARSRYRSMSMTYWLNELDRELEAEPIPAE